MGHSGSNRIRSRVTRRTICAVGLTGLIASLAFAGPARAGAGVQAKCTMSGTLKTGLPIPLIGHKGQYLLDSFTFDCVAVEAPPIRVVTLSADIRSAGTIKNVICGTARMTADEGGITVLDADVSPESTVGPEGYRIMITNLKYDIEVVALEGALYWHNTTGKATVPTSGPLVVVDPKPHDEKARYLGGAVSLLLPGTLDGGSEKRFPEQPPDCTKSFDLFAMFEISDPDVPTLTDR